MTKIGSNIKKIRTIKNISQQSFADIFDLTRGNISSYEESRAEPKIDVVIKIANYFGIPLEHFITKNLTVNEILKYHGDKLIEEENHINTLQLSQTPYINENVYLKCSHGEMNFLEFENYPQLILPESSHHQLLAIQFNPFVPHHTDAQKFDYNDVLIFTLLKDENIQLCENEIGLYVDEHSLYIGKYIFKSEQKIILKLNTLKFNAISFPNKNSFWVLKAVYHYKK